MFSFALANRFVGCQCRADAQKVRNIASSELLDSTSTSDSLLNVSAAAAANLRDDGYKGDAEDDTEDVVVLDDSRRI